MEVGAFDVKVSRQQFIRPETVDPQRAPAEGLVGGRIVRVGPAGRIVRVNDEPVPEQVDGGGSRALRNVVEDVALVAAPSAVPTVPPEYLGNGQRAVSRTTDPFNGFC